MVQEATASSPASQVPRRTTAVVEEALPTVVLEAQEVSEAVLQDEGTPRQALLVLPTPEVVEVVEVPALSTAVQEVQASSSCATSPDD